jgi:TolB-like protein
LPQKFAKAPIETATPAATPKMGSKPWLIVLLTLAGMLLAAGIWILSHQNAPKSAISSSGPVPAGPPILDKSIAVLPFESLSSDKENAFFAQGIEDEIITTLSRISGLRVISRTSTVRYQSAPENLREIARELRVANILEGSVQKAGDRVHINVQLIQTDTDAHLWAQSYDPQLTDISESRAKSQKVLPIRCGQRFRRRRKSASKPNRQPMQTPMFFTCAAGSTRRARIIFSRIFNRPRAFTNKPLRSIRSLLSRTHDSPP